MYRVLVIENSPTPRFALYALMREAGYTPTECPDYWQAIEILGKPEAVAFDAILLGWDSGETELFDLIQSLLGVPPLKFTPLLLFADDTTTELQQWVKKRGNTVTLERFQHIEALEALGQLQRSAENQKPEHRQDGRKNPVKKQAGNIKILLLEDSRWDMKRFKRLLNETEYNSTFVQSLDVALDVLRAQPIDIFIIEHALLEFEDSRNLIQQSTEDGQISRFRLVTLLNIYDEKSIMDSLKLGAVECIFKAERDSMFRSRLDALARQIVVQKTAETERRRFGAILGSVGEGVYGVDTKGQITFLNPAGLEMLGLSKGDEYIGKPAYELIHIRSTQRRSDPLDHDALAQAYFNGSELEQTEAIFSHSSGRKINVSCTVRNLHVNDVREGSVVAFRDITDRKQMERRLIRQATRDPLTDLYNRRYFDIWLKREVRNVGQRPVRQSALLYIDLDQFKYLNDTAGHDAGDSLLIDVGKHLRMYVRTTDVVGRLGGDEFAIILRDAASEEALRIADMLRNRLQEVTFINEEINFKVNCSIGVAMIEQAMSAKDVLVNADIACQIAKRKGRNVSHLYSVSEGDERSVMNEEITWSTRLVDAIEHNGFQLIFQPILAISDFDPDYLPAEPNRLWASLSHLPDHYEVLIRLKGNDNEVISPRAFLPMAERFNLIHQIDLWVVQESLKHLEKLHQYGREASISVNLSGFTLNESEAMQQIVSMLKKTDVPPSSMVFEITEMAAIQKLESVRECIEQIRSEGWRFALDDFGTGFSSFSQLKYLPVDIVKIDGQFVVGMVDDPIDRAIVIAINDIAHSLGMETIAEYVESAQTLRMLSEYGIDHAQGFYISRPLTNIFKRADSTAQMLRLTEPVDRL